MDENPSHMSAHAMLLWKKKQYGGVDQWNMQVYMQVSATTSDIQAYG